MKKAKLSTENYKIEPDTYQPYKFRILYFLQKDVSPNDMYNTLMTHRSNVNRYLTDMSWSLFWTSFKKQIFSMLKKFPYAILAQILVHIYVCVTLAKTETFSNDLLA